MFVFSGKTDIGKVRTENQDCFEYGELCDNVGYAIVCDGMGGYNGGSKASETAVSVISRRLHAFYNPEINESGIRDLIIKSCEAANAEIFSISRKDPDLEGMGTTAVIAVISDMTAHILHVGDSRAYRINSGSILQITTDHSMVQQLIERGEISEEDAKTHPHKNVITRALGVEGYLSFDYNTIALESGDTLLLCTDGLTNMLPDEEIASIVTSNKNADGLIEAANEKGGRDNVTAVLINIERHEIKLF